jgi:hypothetical protein
MMSDTQSSKKTEPEMPFRKLCAWVFVGLLAVTAITVRAAVMSTGVRVLLFGTLCFGIFTGLIYIIKLPGSHPKVLYPGLFFIALFVVWMVLADRPPDVPPLRATYVKRLMKFDGTRYVRGGETTSGVDCSGLARSALWQAMLIEGAREFNPELMGKKFWKFWWRDLSARAMLIGTYGYTKKIGSAEKLAGYDSSNLEPGDLAVAGNGIHVLIYLGEDKWIEASPDDGKVVVNKAPAKSRRIWFNVPVTFVRWKILQEPDT